MLARLLSTQGFTFTIAVTEELSAKVEDSAISGDALTIRYATIPSESASEERSETSSFDFSKTLRLMDGLQSGFELLLSRLASSPPGISCIIFDCFVLWGSQVASKFNIPAFAFYTSNAHVMALTLHARPLVANNGLSDLDKTIDNVPGLFSLQVCDLPRSLLEYPSFVTNIPKDIDKTAGLIINTVLELEKEPLEVIRSEVPCYTIGPMTLMLDMDKLTPEPVVALWAEQRECLDWLDAKPNASVLFVAFGSLANLSGDQMEELAAGLEASGQAFLWVIRSNSTHANCLPEGFNERTKDRGLIISWAPQLEVLLHPAVGAFITHCGWNSLTENLSLKAVPMICWPQLAEQRLNKRLVVDKWKVGLDLQEENGIIKRTDLEKAVREVIQGDLRQKLGKRALELKELIISAVREGGSSKCSLKSLGKDIRLAASRKQKPSYSQN